MKKLFTSQLFFSLVAIALFSIFLVTPVRAESLDDYVYTIADGKATITEYKGSATELTIPSRLGEADVTSIGDGVFANKKSLIKVTLGSGLKTIGSGAFYNTDLERIIIPDSVESIGEGAFANNESLIEVTLGSGLKTIGRGAFSGTDLERIIIPGSMESIGEWALSSIGSLTEVTLGSGLKTIGEFAFSGTDLSSVTIPDSVESIGDWAFMGNYQLKSVYFLGDAPDINSPFLYHSDFYIYYLSTATGTTTDGAMPFSSIWNDYNTATSTDIDNVITDTKNLTADVIRGENENILSITKPLSLPTNGESGSSITWKSSRSDVISNEGNIIEYPTTEEEIFYLTLTATISSGDKSIYKSFNLRVLPEPSEPSSPEPSEKPKGGSSSAPISLPAAIGTGDTSTAIPMGQTTNIGTVSNTGNNILAYVNSQAKFQALGSANNSHSSSHSLTISSLDLYTNTVTLTIASTPQTVSLKKGESKLVDLDGDNIYDIELTFVDVYVNRAEITVKALNTETISNTETPTNTPETNKIKEVTTEELKNASKANDSLIKKLAGRILLQVETRGQAWYLDKTSLKRYYLPDGPSAYQALRKFGLGISNHDLNKIPVSLDILSGKDSDGDRLPDSLEMALGTNPNNIDSDGDGYDDYTEILNNQDPNSKGSLVFDTDFAKKHAGRIFLQVESHGEAWYVNPTDGHRYYLANGEAAYQIMRQLSLGVSNANLNSISVGEW